MNLVQFKTNIHEFERCERDVILFILDYLTEGEGGGDQKSGAEGVQISREDCQGSGQVYFAKLYSSKVCMSCTNR